jgi:hypothetical protein
MLTNPILQRSSAANADLVQAEPAQPLGRARSPRADRLTGVSLRRRPSYRRMTPWRTTPRQSTSLGPNSDKSPATRWCARGQHWRSSNVNALTIGAHERQSTLGRRSRMEASGPRRYVTARGLPTGRLRGPRCGTGCGERRYARGRPRGGCGVPPPPAESYSGQTHPRIGRSCRTSVRTLRRRRSRRRTRPDRAVPDPLRLPSWWTS